MKTYKCPLCGSKLPKDKYEAALHIQREREQAHVADIERLRKVLQQKDDKLKELT